MQTITLYKYSREGGGVTVSPLKPDAEYTEMYRLVAEAEKVITQDGENFTACVDVESVVGWYEMDSPYTYTETETPIDSIENDMEELGR